MTDNFPPFLFSFYESLPRQGPGNDTITRSLLECLPDLPEKPVIIDMGCGTGAQTLVLAGRGQVTAVDFHEPFLKILMKTARSRNLESRITPVHGSMAAIPPGTGPADLIWSEGAIYIIGFEKGLRLWWDVVRPGGYIVVSEATRLVDDPPAEAAEYWSFAYPDVKTIPENCRIISETGYRCLTTRLLPHAAWEDFYFPQKERIATLRKGNLTAEEEAFLGEIEQEIRIQEQYPDTFGYVFYVIQRSA
jgi:SAM-dependent methyltransferase